LGTKQKDAAGQVRATPSERFYPFANIPFPSFCFYFVFSLIFLTCCSQWSRAAVFLVWAFDVILYSLRACSGSDKSVLIKGMRITFRIVHFDKKTHSRLSTNKNWYAIGPFSCEWSTCPFQKLEHRRSGTIAFQCELGLSTFILNWQFFPLYIKQTIHKNYVLMEKLPGQIFASNVHIISNSLALEQKAENLPCKWQRNKQQKYR